MNSDDGKKGEFSRDPEAVSGEPGVARGWTELEAGLRRGAVAVPRGGQRSWVNGGSEGEGFVGGEERETDCFWKEKALGFCFIIVFFLKKIIHIFLVKTSLYYIYSKIQQHEITGLGSCLTKTTKINK